MTQLSDVAKSIKTGDLLLWRPEPGDRFGHAVCVGSGGGQYSHAGMAVWIQQPFHEWRLFSMDMLLEAGGVMQPLDRMVQRWPGLCDHFEANADDAWPEWDGDEAAQHFMDHYLGLPYGRENARIAARTRFAFARWIWYPNRDDQYIAEGPPFCSHAVCESSRLGGGVDTVANLSCPFTWPSDLAGSIFYRRANERLT